MSIQDLQFIAALGEGLIFAAFIGFILYLGASTESHMGIAFLLIIVIYVAIFNDYIELLNINKLGGE